LQEFRSCRSQRAPARSAKTLVGARSRATGVARLSTANRVRRPWKFRERASGIVQKETSRRGYPDSAGARPSKIAKRDASLTGHPDSFPDLLRRSRSADVPSPGSIFEDFLNYLEYRISSILLARMLP
jgi:hypothetical protein